MSVMTIRLSDDQHDRLKMLAKQRGISLNKLFQEFASQALTEFDLEARFRARAVRGSAERGLALLEKLETASSGSGA